MKIAIIGGGAAGLMAGGFCQNRGMLSLYLMEMKNAVKSFILLARADVM